MHRARIGIGIAIGTALIACGGGEARFEGSHHGEAEADRDEHAEHHAAGAELHAAGAGLHAAGATEHQAGATEPHAQAAGPRPTRVLEDGSRLFGAELRGERESTELATIVATPAQYDGQVVRTSGTIERVCQRMGCWMELRGENAPAVRVPMAGHAFFLPRDVEGRAATIEGRVAVQELTPQAREHLASEGALATASSLSIDATSVIVR